MSISAVVMASGLSRRMNADKLHMKIKNKEIYEYILETVNKYEFHEIIVASKDEEILKKSSRLGYTAVLNTKYDLGQSESIKSALRIAEQADGYMFFVADQPFIKLSTIERLCGEFNKNKSNIIVPYYNGTKGNPVIFPYCMKEQLLNLEKDMGGRFLINSFGDKVKRVDIVTQYESVDIDTMEDYERFKNINFTE
jgi:molybdenum cofactor cytidylyltransferase